jgi:hypothetical protein
VPLTPAGMELQGVLGVQRAVQSWYVPVRVLASACSACSSSGPQPCLIDCVAELHSLWGRMQQQVVCSSRSCKGFLVPLCVLLVLARGSHG